MARPALAGPPYITDDPEPTDYTHYEIYAFGTGTATRDGASDAFGIDFNYGAAPDLQLTAVLPMEHDVPSTGPSETGIGNIELAAKYRFLHQEDSGWDVAVFPRISLPSSSPRSGERHFSFMLPFWAERDWGQWSTFGGGGCEIDNGDRAQDSCLVGWALARQVLPDLQIGVEIFHQTAETKGARATSGIGAGLRYDVSDNIHWLAYAGPGIQNADETDRYTWYSSILFTF